MRCPVCGAPEAAIHLNGCTNVPLFMRPCCGTMVWSQREELHRSDCEWAVGKEGLTLQAAMARPYMERIYADGRPWYGLRWSTD